MESSDPSRVFLALPLLAGVSDARKRALAESAVGLTLAPGTLLADCGEPAAFLDVIAEGRVRLFLPDGAVTLDFIERGEVLGLSALCAERGHPVSAEAVTEVSLLRLDPEVAWSAILAEEEGIHALFATVTTRLKGLLAQVNDLKLRTTTQRLAMFLVTLARRLDPEAVGAVVVPLPGTRRQLAARLGMTAESLSRSMARLAGHGVSPEGRTAVRVASLEALSDLAGLHALDEDLG